MITDVRLMQLTLENFRGFTEVKIPFEQDLTVFIARNGGGKTSVLDAAAEGLRQWIEQSLLGEDLSPTQLSKRDINYKTEIATIILALKVNFIHYWKEELEDGATEQMSAEKKAVFEITFKLSKGSPDVGKASITANTDSETPEDALQLLQEMLKILLDKEPLPVILYYRAETEDNYYNNGYPNGIAEEEAATTSQRIRVLYKDALQTRRSGFKDFYNWFDQRSKYELYSKEKGYLEGRDTQLSQVLTAIEQLLSDEATTYQNLEIDYRSNRMAIEKKTAQETVILEVGQLSSGEKHLFALVSQLALKLVQANPGSENPLAEGFGIVLLDELDAHLHPAWQRTVVGKLREVFPKVQFVVTTHSPLLLGTIPSTQILLIEEGETYAPIATYGRDVSTIISQLMDVQTNELEKDYSKIYRLLATQKLSEAAEELMKLRIKFTEREEDVAPEFLELEAILERKSITQP